MCNEFIYSLVYVNSYTLKCTYICLHVYIYLCMYVYRDTQIHYIYIKVSGVVKSLKHYKENKDWEI